MKLNELINKLVSGKKSAAIIVAAGTLGLCLIMISSLLPKENKKIPEKSQAEAENVTDYCIETEKKLTDFLSRIDGVGKVNVLVTLNNREEYVYAKEGRKVISDNKTEEEEEYVMIGGSGEKSALIETVKTPEISGVVIACSGSGSAVVRESIYNSVSVDFNIPTSRIYVTQLES